MELWAFFKFLYTSLYEPRLMEPAGGWCTQLGGLSFALQALFATWLAYPAQTVQFLYLETWKVFKECRAVGWLCIRLARVYCMSQLLLHVQKPLSLTLQWLCLLLMFRTARRLFCNGLCSRGDSVECLLVPYVFSSRCICYVHDAIYIFSCRVCRYDLCVQF